jgi:hypothetical protein
MFTERDLRESKLARAYRARLDAKVVIYRQVRKPSVPLPPK